MAMCDVTDWRPSFVQRGMALQVLKGDYLPPSVADEQISDLLRAIPEQPGMLERITQGLFSLPLPSSTQPVHAGAAAAPGDPAANTGLVVWRGASALAAAGVPAVGDDEARADVLDALRQACLVHGAVPMRSAEVGSRSAQHA